MGALSNYLESGILNHIFRGTKLTDWTTLYVGLVSSYNASSLEAGTLSAEITNASYARQPVPVNASVWSQPYASGNATAIHNASGITFPVSDGDTGNVAGVIICNSLSAGDILFHGPLTNTRNVTDQSQFVFPSGSLKVTFD